MQAVRGQPTTPCVERWVGSQGTLSAIIMLFGCVQGPSPDIRVYVLYQYDVNYIMLEPNELMAMADSGGGGSIGVFPVREFCHSSYIP